MKYFDYYVQDRTDKHGFAVGVLKCYHSNLVLKNCLSWENIPEQLERELSSFNLCDNYETMANEYFNRFNVRCFIDIKILRNFLFDDPVLVEYNLFENEDNIDKLENPKSKVIATETKSISPYEMNIDYDDFHRVEKINHVHVYKDIKDIDLTVTNENKKENK